MFTESFTIHERFYFSISHIATASLFAKKSLDIEIINEQGSFLQDLPLQFEHRGYVVSSILQSVAFLEATINEIFSDCAENSFAKLRQEQVSLVGRMWMRGIPRTAKYSILEKYEILLDLLNLDKFNISTSPYQDVKLLVELRNALIHYEPNNIMTSNSDNYSFENSHKFEKKFYNKFEENKFYKGTGNAYFPNKLLGAHCAAWAVKSAVAYTDTFFNRLNITATYNHIRDKLL